MSVFPRRKSKESPSGPTELVTPEKARDSTKVIEAKGEVEETSAEQSLQPSQEAMRTANIPATTPVAAHAPARTVDPITEKIEHILEEDLTDLYLKMAPGQQEIFKHTGEETAAKIRVLLAKAKVNARKIFHLLREWLKLIPGVNRFFLEQEAKIKTDKILFMHEQDKEL